MRRHLLCAASVTHPVKRMKTQGENDEDEGSDLVSGCQIKNIFFLRIMQLPRAEAIARQRSTAAENFLENLNLRS